MPADDKEADNSRALSSSWGQRIAVEQIQWIIKECCELSQVSPPVGSFPYDEMIAPGNFDNEYPWHDPLGEGEEP